MKKVEGRSFTSNTTKLLKHLDKLKDFQDGKPPSPVMAHISLINVILHVRFVVSPIET